VQEQNAKNVPTSAATTVTVEENAKIVLTSAEKTTATAADSETVKSVPTSAVKTVTVEENAKNAPTSAEKTVATVADSGTVKNVLTSAATIVTTAMDLPEEGKISDREEVQVVPIVPARTNGMRILKRNTLPAVGNLLHVHAAEMPAMVPI
jgi:hypothetical protein